MNARDKLIQELRRSGTGHTGMGASTLVDDFQQLLADHLRAAGHEEAACLIDPKLMSVSDYVGLGRPDPRSST